VVPVVLPLGVRRPEDHGLFHFLVGFLNAAPNPNPIPIHVSSAVLSRITRLWKFTGAVVWKQSRIVLYGKSPPGLAAINETASPQPASSVER
jgi:hypothetical protein